MIDMCHQGILYALRKPNRFCDAKAVRIRQETGIYSYLLGHLLLSHNRRQDACTVFERDMQRAREQGLDYLPAIECDMCDVPVPREGEVDGVYFVCTTCTNIDLCSSCMEEYKSTRKIDIIGAEFCENHEFLKVPSDGWQDVAAGKVNKQGETEDEWLARLAAIDGGDAAVWRDMGVSAQSIEKPGSSTDF